jgi:hypothetical protein
MNSQENHFYSPEEWFPPQQDFIEDVSSLISQIPQTLSVPSEKLDMSRASLLRLNKAICRKGKNECCIPTIVQMLTAYLGEMLRQSVNGYWEFRPVSDGTLHPWVVAPNKYACPVPTLICKELCDGRGCYLENAFDRELISLTSLQPPVEQIKVGLIPSRKMKFKLKRRTRSVDVE